MSGLVKQFCDTVCAQPEHGCLVEGDAVLSGATVLRQVVALREDLRKKGITAGHAVAVMVYNQPIFVTAMMAIRSLGAIAVPINIQMLPQDIAYVLQHAAVRHAFVHQDFAERLAPLGLPMTIVSDEALPAGLEVSPTDDLTALVADVTSGSTSPESPEDLAFLMYTSGTTGSPKGVMLSEANITSNIEGFLQRLPFSRDERVLMALPMFHAYGFVIVMAALLKGATVILVPKFQPRQILTQTVVHQATILPLVPTFFGLFLDIMSRQPDLQLPSLKYCVSGGAALPEALLRRVETSLNVTVLEGYGLTETSPVVAVNCPTLGSRPGTVGPILDNVTVAILSETGVPIPQTGDPVAEGEIAVKGPNVMAGYYKSPEATAEAIDVNGWFRTGDLGYVNAEGCLVISGRKKDLIIKAGENLSPRPIEEALAHHPAVQDVCVLGMPDAKLGERVVACVTLKPDTDVVSPSELTQHCRQHLANFYVPDEMLILSELPKTATGKVIKKLVKQQLVAQAGAVS